MGFVQFLAVACLLCSTWPQTRAAPVMTLVGSSTQVSVHAVTDAATQTPTTEEVTVKIGARSDDTVTASSESSPETTSPKAAETTTHKSEAQMADEPKTVPVVDTTPAPSSPAPAVSEKKAEVQADQPSPKTEESKVEEKASVEVTKHDESKEKEEPRVEKTEELKVDTTPEPAKEAMEKKAEESAVVPVTQPKESEPVAEFKEPETTVTHSDVAAAESKVTDAPVDVASATTHATDVSSEAPRPEEPAVLHTAMEAHIESPVPVEKTETPVEVKSDAAAVTTPAAKVPAVEDRPQDEPVQAESDVDERTVEAPKNHKEAAEKSGETAVAEKVTTEAAGHLSSAEAQTEKTDVHAQSSTEAGDHKEVSTSSAAPSQTTAADHTEGEKVTTGTPSVAAMEAESPSVVEKAADVLPKAALDVAKAAEEVLTSTHVPEAPTTHAAEAAASSESTSSASSPASEATTVKVETSSGMETTATPV